MTESQNPARRALSRLRGRLGGTRSRGIRAELEAERERITRLEAELDELRRDSLRVAELVDLVERRLTP
ncbi:DUF6752 domain-containing protein [Leucobacter luti]|uniref:DUF6752 domain-containing protein n=1 Tax=Leucobacter luti TaxID=340320 RepID=A0A4Q7TR42_9MICO|nr:DUF6752 domain-containing protein [Leucobacter luti]MBL3699715.1 hypothetical protein [Leucobacter luti]RZT62963.1 hypothetical protein EV139_2672 [Leucobacter luti]